MKIPSVWPSGFATRSAGAGFLSLGMYDIWAGKFCVGGHPVACSMCSIILGPYPLDTTWVSHDRLKCPQILPHVPWRTVLLSDGCCKKKTFPFFLFLFISFFRVVPWCCKKLQQKLWLQTIQIYSLPILGVRVRQWVLRGSDQGVSRAGTFWSFWGEIRFLAFVCFCFCLFFGLGVAPYIPWLVAPLFNFKAHRFNICSCHHIIFSSTLTVLPPSCKDPCHYIRQFG